MIFELNVIFIDGEHILLFKMLFLVLNMKSKYVVNYYYQIKCIPTIKLLLTYLI